MCCYEVEQSSSLFKIQLCLLTVSVPVQHMIG